MLSKSICEQCLKSIDKIPVPVYTPVDNADRCFWSCTAQIKKGDYKFIMKSDEPPAGCEKLMEQAVYNSMEKK